MSATRDEPQHGTTADESNKIVSRVVVTSRTTGYVMLRYAPREPQWINISTAN